jgi:hypothetical protein
MLEPTGRDRFALVDDLLSNLFASKGFFGIGGSFILFQLLIFWSRFEESPDCTQGESELRKGRDEPASRWTELGENRRR